MATAGTTRAAAMLVPVLVFSATSWAQAEVSPELLRRLAAHDARMEEFERRSVTTVTTDSTERDGDGKVLHQRRQVSERRARSSKASSSRSRAWAGS